MTKSNYIEMTEKTRQIVEKAPYGYIMLKIPTYLCALIYIGAVAISVMSCGINERIVRAVIIPALCFIIVTIIRPMIHRMRPYEMFDIPPVGKWEPGNRTSMPSRHSASAAVISFAVVFLFPYPAVILCMSLLTMIICILRVVTGKHFASDVIVAVMIALVLSWIGYTV